MALENVFHLKFSHIRSVRFSNINSLLILEECHITWNADGNVGECVVLRANRAGVCRRLNGATLRPLEKMIVRFGKRAEVVRQEIVRRRDAEEREARGLAQQAAAAGPLARAAHRRRARGPAHAAADTVQLLT